MSAYLIISWLRVSADMVIHSTGVFDMKSVGRIHGTLNAQIHIARFVRERTIVFADVLMN